MLKQISGAQLRLERVETRSKGLPALRPRHWKIQEGMLASEFRLVGILLGMDLHNAVWLHLDHHAVCMPLHDGPGPLIEHRFLPKNRFPLFGTML